ncbi:PEPxxWA-CTERM sorting domain-containing protein [Thermaurantiacus sp.]
MTMMKQWVLAAALVAAPASAVQLVGIDSPGGNSASLFDSGPGLLLIDFAFNAFQPISVDLALEPGDEGGIGFNSVIEIFTGVTLGQNLGTLDVTLLDGPTFAIIGDVDAFFSNPIVGVAPGAASFRIRFRPAGEGVGLVLGAPFGAGTDFAIAPGTLSAGDRFRLVLTPTAIPEPGTWAMLIAGFGIVGLAMRQRDAAVRA